MTVAPLVRLWGITTDSPRVPGADEISNAQSYIGWDQAVLDEEAHTVFLPRPGISLDLGAVVKGYAAEKCRDLYEKAGVTGGIVSLGGTVAAVGTRSDGTPFQIGLRDPKGGSNDIFGVLTGEGRIIATSGGTSGILRRTESGTSTFWTPAPGIRWRRTCSASRRSAATGCWRIICPPPFTCWAVRWRRTT